MLRSMRSSVTAALVSGALSVSLPAAADTTEERDVEDFDGVAFAVPGKLYLEQGEEYLRLEGDEDLLAEIITEVKDGTLVIRRESSIWTRSRGTLTAYVGIEDLESLAVAGSGDLIAEDLKAGDLEIKVSGSGEVTIEQLQAEDVEMKVSGSGAISIEDMTGEDLEATIAGSGRIEVGGEVEAQDIRISGSGDFRGQDLSTTSTSVVVSGSGDVDVRAEDELDVMISGSGSVRYGGDPSISKVVSGSGSVKPAG